MCSQGGHSDGDFDCGDGHRGRQEGWDGHNYQQVGHDGCQRSQDDCPDDLYVISLSG